MLILILIGRYSSVALNGHSLPRFFTVVFDLERATAELLFLADSVEKVGVRIQSLLQSRVSVKSGDALIMRIDKAASYALSFKSYKQPPTLLNTPSHRIYAASLSCRPLHRLPLGSPTCACPISFLRTLSRFCRPGKISPEPLRRRVRTSIVKLCEIMPNRCCGQL